MLSASAVEWINLVMVLIAAVGGVAVIAVESTRRR